MRSLGKVLFFVAGFVGLMFLASVAVRAQMNASGSVQGHLQDSSGAAIPGAKVTLRNEQTGVNQTFVTGNAGDYLFVNQIPDSYDVVVERQGFKTATSAGLILQVDQTLRQDFTLEVGTPTEQVTVSAVASMLQTDNATIGEVVDQRAIESLPLNGRDYVNLIAINAGTTHTPSGGIQSSVFDLHGLDQNFQMTSVNGQLPDATNYMIDGVTDTDFFFSKPISLISADSIQEFKLQNGLYSAAYGPGAQQVNVAIKSGTNQLHGTAYDYWENEALQPASPITAAENAFDHTHNPVGPSFNQNQFGFTLGGPVVLPKVYKGRDRTFWFAGYEGGREIQGSAVGLYQVPTAAERTGNFQDWPYPIYNPATTGSVPATATDPTGRVAFPNNTIPSSMFSPLAQKWLNYFPKANLTTCTALPCYDLSGTTESAILTDTVNGRIDHKISDRDRLNGTVIVSRDIPSTPSLFPASTSEDYQKTRMVGLDYDHDASPTAINSLRAGYNREFYHQGASTAYGPDLTTELGLMNGNPIPAFWGLPTLGMTDGYSTPGNQNNGYTQRENVFQWADIFTKIHGRHTFTAGADVRRWQLYELDGFQSEGVINFTGAYTASNPAGPTAAGPTSGNAMADFMLGYPLSITRPAPLATDDYDIRYTDWNFFFQDDFRVSPRLTLNLGIRYEIPKSPHSVTNDGEVFDPATPGGGALWASKSYTALLAANPAASIYYQCCASNELVPTPMKDFAPRLGVAFRPLPGSDKLVIRGGYGIFYEFYTMYYQGDLYDSNLLTLLQPNPNYPAATGLESASPLALNTLWLPPISVTPTNVPVSYATAEESIKPNNPTPYSQQWSLGGQYAFTNTMMLDVSYVGAHGADLPIKLQFNQATPPTVSGDPCNNVTDFSLGSAACKADPNFQPVDTRVPYKNYAGTSYFQEANIIDSNYDALQVTLKKRFSQGLQFTVAYTWSRTFDEGSSIAGYGGETNRVQNDHDAPADYGPSAFDMPQRLVMTYLYDVPIGKGRKFNAGRLGNEVLGGWKVSGIVTESDGVPYTIFCCSSGSNEDQMGTTRSQDYRVNLVGNPKIANPTVLQEFNTAAFTTPALGTFGNLARNTMRAPGIHEGDLSFFKDFHFTERHQLELRLDIFNVFSSSYAVPHQPGNDLYTSPTNCTPGPGPGPGGTVGNCSFGSLVPLNGLGALNLWNPRVLQLSLRYRF